MISIIIPTLNEEDFLPGLLESIKKQSFGDYEIIIADAGSKDATLEIAKKYGCTVVPGGLPGPGRNIGAKTAKGNILFFLDSDTLLPEGFLEKSMQEFTSRNLDIATFRLAHFPGGFLSYIFLNIIYNNLIILAEKIKPYSAVGILIKKELFEKLNGYDETIRLTEDYDLGRRAVKYGKYGVIRAGIILSSDRRFRKDGWVKTSAKYFLNEVYNVFFGPAKKDLFNYKFNHYKKDKK